MNRYASRIPNIFCLKSQHIGHNCRSKKPQPRAIQISGKRRWSKKSKTMSAQFFKHCTKNIVSRKNWNQKFLRNPQNLFPRKLKFGSSSVLWKENALKQSIYSCYSSYIMCLRSTFFFAFSSLLLLRLHYQSGCKFRVTFGYLLCLQNALKLFRGKKAHFIQTKITMAH